MKSYLKKLIYIGVIITSTMLGSCKTDRVTSVEDDAISQKFAEFEDVAKLHSDALSIIFDEVVNKPAVTRSIQSGELTKGDIENYSKLATEKAAKVNDRGLSVLTSKYHIGNIVTKNDIVSVEPT